MSVCQRNIALVCNPTFENNKAVKVADGIAGILRQQQVAFSIFTTHWPQVWDGFSEAWIIGGDGTLNYFINQYPDVRLPLSVFAGGSGNDFHWMLYGDVGMEQQVHQLLQGTPRLIDAGTCNGRLFLNGVGIGFDGAIVEDLIGKKKLAGKGSYLLSILKLIFKFREVPCNLEVGGEAVSGECFLISVAGGQRYGGGFFVTPRASVTDALLDVSVVGKIAPVKRLRFLPLLEKGEHLELPFVNYRQAGAVVVQSPAILPAHLDGELMRADRFEITCLPERFSFLL